MTLLNRISLDSYSCDIILIAYLVKMIWEEHSRSFYFSIQSRVGSQKYLQVAQEPSRTKWGKYILH